MSKRQVNHLIDEILKNQKFIKQVKKCVNQSKEQALQKGQLPTFAFEKAAKYPWSITDQNMPIQGQQMIEQMTDMIAILIDNNLHQILNKEFLNISNEILVIRDEINEFVKDQDVKVKKIKEEFNQNLESFRKKMVIQQNSSTNNTNKQIIHFTRTRTNASLNASHASNYTASQSKQTKVQLQTIKKDIQLIKNQLQKQQVSSHISEKLVYIQQKLQNQIVNLRIKIESSKTKTQKGLGDLSVKMSESNNKDLIASEVKRAVKSHMKVYLQQITICKQDRMHLHEQLAKTDKGLQDYFASQMKPIWMLLQDLKKRQTKMENQFNLNNESFIFQ